MKPSNVISKVSANTTKGKVSITKVAPKAKVVKRVANNATSYKIEVLQNNRFYKEERMKFGKMLADYLGTKECTERSKSIIKAMQKSAPIFKTLEQYAQSQYKGVDTGKQSIFKTLQIANKFGAAILAANDVQSVQKCAQMIADVIDAKRAAAKVKKLKREASQVV